MVIEKYRLACDISFMAWHISKCLNLAFLEFVGKHCFRTCQVYPSLCWLWTTLAQPHIIMPFLSFCLFVFLLSCLSVSLSFCLIVLVSLFQKPPGLNPLLCGLRPHQSHFVFLSFFSMGPLSLSGLKWMHSGFGWAHTWVLVIVSNWHDYVNEH